MFNFDTTVAFAALEPAFKAKGIPLSAMTRTTNMAADVSTFLLYYTNDIPADIVVMVTGVDAVAEANYYGLPKSSMAAGFMVIDGIPHISVDLTQVNGSQLEGAVEHELVHYRQWLRGDLEFNGDGTISWKGVPQPLLRPDAGAAYFNQPWEREAYIETFHLMSRVNVDKLLALYF